MTHLTTDTAVTTIAQGEPTRLRAEDTVTETGREHQPTASSTDHLAAVLQAAADEALKTALPGRYTPALAAQIAADITTRLRQPAPTACPVYRDCADARPGHYDHSGHDLKVADDTDGSTILDAGMVALSGKDRHAIVYVRNAEFTDAASVRAKTTELRRFLDEVDAMADRVFADHQARG